MKNRKTRIAIGFVISALLLICTVVGLTVSAADDGVYEIEAINVVYEDRPVVAIAVDAPASEKDNIELTYTHCGKIYTATYWEDMDIYNNGTLYPVFFTVGIAPKDLGEPIFAEAHKKDASGYTPIYRNIGVSEYLFTRLYKLGYINATEGEDLHRKEFYLSALEFGAQAQRLLWNDKPENADNQRTLLTDLIPVYVNDGTANGSSFAIYETATDLTLEYTGNKAFSVWRVTTWQNGVGTEEIVYGNSITVTAPTTIEPIVMELNESDVALVNAMNAALDAEGTQEPVTTETLYEVLNLYGFTAKNYSTEEPNTFFFWDGSLNRVVYTDSDYQVLFPEGVTTNQETWISLNGEIKTPDVSTVVGADETVTLAGGVEGGAQLAALLNSIEEGKAITNHITTIKIPETVNLMGADVMISTLTQPLTIEGVAGQTTIKNLVVNEAERVGEGQGGTRNYVSGLVGYVAADVTFKDITIENTVVGNFGTSLVGAFVGSVDKDRGGKTAAELGDNGLVDVVFDNCHLKNVTVRGMQKVGGFVGYIEDGNTVTVEDNCTANNVTVEASVGLAGGIFGYINKGTVTVKDATNFDDVTVKLVKVPTGYYITDNNDKVYAIDLEDDFTIAGTRKNGLYRYFPTTAQYGWKNGDKGDTDVRNADQFKSNLYMNHEKAIIAYGATEWVPPYVDDNNRVIEIATAEELKDYFASNYIKGILTADITLTENISVTKEKKLNLNNKTLTVNSGAAARPLNVKAGANVTIYGGDIANTFEGTYGVCDNYGTLTLNDIFYTEGAGDAGASFRNMTGGKMYVNGGSYIASAATANQLFRNHAGATGCYLEINNAYVTSMSTNSYTNHGEYAIVIRAGEAKLTNVNVYGQFGTIAIEGGKAIINGGECVDINANAGQFYGIYVSNAFIDSELTVSKATIKGGIYDIFIGDSNGGGATIDDKTIDVTLNEVILAGNGLSVKDYGTKGNVTVVVEENSDPTPAELDEIMVRKMSVALTLEGKPGNLDDALAALEKNGINIENLIPLSSGYSYVWNEETMTIELSEDATNAIGVAVKSADEFKAALATAKYIRLDADVAITENVAIENENLTINLNGNTITLNSGAAARPLNIKEGANVTISGGYIVNSFAGTYGTVDNYGTLTLNNVSYTEGEGDDGAAFRNMIGGKMYVNGGSYSASADNANQLFRNHAGATGCYLEINNATITSMSANSDNNHGNYAIVIRAGEAKLTNVNVYGQYGAIALEGGKVTINGGEYVDTNANAGQFYGIYVSNSHADSELTVSNATIKGGLYDICVNDNNGEGGAAIDDRTIDVTLTDVTLSGNGLSTKDGGTKGNVTVINE